MKKLSWETKVIIVLLVVSAAFFTINYIIFSDPRFTINLVTLQLAFLPISTIILTFLLGRYIARRNRQERIEKLSTLIDIFFGDVGTPLLRQLALMDGNRQELRERAALSEKWTDKDFEAALAYARGHKPAITVDPAQLPALKELLAKKRPLLMRLMENPTLIEHQTFTELLRALFHLTQELIYREDVMALPKADYLHIGFDVRRTYSALVTEWLCYLRVLKKSYPYYFSLEARVNPLDPAATAEVHE